MILPTAQLDIAYTNSILLRTSARLGIDSTFLDI